MTRVSHLTRDDDTFTTDSDCTFPGRFDQGNCACVLYDHQHDKKDSCYCRRRRKVCPRHRITKSVYAYTLFRHNKARSQKMWTKKLVRLWLEECFAFAGE